MNILVFCSSIDVMIEVNGISFFLQYIMVQYIILQYIVVQYSIVQYIIVQYILVQFIIWLNKMNHPFSLFLLSPIFSRLPSLFSFLFCLFSVRRSFFVSFGVIFSLFSFLSSFVNLTQAYVSLRKLT